MPQKQKRLQSNNTLLKLAVSFKSPQRIARIRTPGELIAESAVLNDGADDNLNDDAGLDWFLADESEDTVHYNPDDVITNLDLAWMDSD